MARHLPARWTWPITAALGWLLLGCSPSATLQLTGQGYTSNGMFPSTPLEPRTLRVRVGDRFGHEAAAAFGVPLEEQFQVLALPGPGQVQVRFAEGLVIAGEPIARPSARNPVLLSAEPTCFRTRWYDAGVDLCLQVMRP